MSSVSHLAQTESTDQLDFREGEHKWHPWNPNCTNWRPFAFARSKEIGAYPNRLYFNANLKAGAVVVVRNDGGSWALNVAAVNHVLDAVRNHRLDRGFAILTEKNSTTIVSVMEIEEVAKNLEGTPPRGGDFGDYWWVEEEFKTNQSAKSNADAYF